MIKSVFRAKKSAENHPLEVSGYTRGVANKASLRQYDLIAIIKSREEKRKKFTGSLLLTDHTNVKVRE